MKSDHELECIIDRLGQEQRRLTEIARTGEKAIAELAGTAQDDRWDPTKATLPKKGKKVVPPDEIPALIASLKKEMFGWAEKLEFEKAAALRDRIAQLEELHVDLG